MKQLANGVLGMFLFGGMFFSFAFGSTAAIAWGFVLFDDASAELVLRITGDRMFYNVMNFLAYWFIPGFTACGASIGAFVTKFTFTRPTD